MFMIMNMSKQLQINMHEIERKLKICKRIATFIYFGKRIAICKAPRMTPCKQSSKQ